MAKRRVKSRPRVTGKAGTKRLSKKETAERAGFRPLSGYTEEEAQEEAAREESRQECLASWRRNLTGLRGAREREAAAKEAGGPSIMADLPADEWRPIQDAALQGKVPAAWEPRSGPSFGSSLGLGEEGAAQTLLAQGCIGRKEKKETLSWREVQDKALRKEAALRKKEAVLRKKEAVLRKKEAALGQEKGDGPSYWDWLQNTALRKLCSAHHRRRTSGQEKEAAAAKEAANPSNPATPLLVQGCIERLRTVHGELLALTESVRGVAERLLGPIPAVINAPETEWVVASAPPGSFPSGALAELQSLLHRVAADQQVLRAQVNRLSML